MLKVDVNIKIGPHEFDFVTAEEIDSSWKNASDTAKITLPRNISKFWGGEKQLLQDLIKRGDEVEISLGYDGRLNTEFVGYVSHVHMGMPPVVIECEDTMWKLKQETINESYKSVNLKELIDDLVGFNPYVEDTEVLDAPLGPFRIEKQSPAAVLDYLKKSYGFKYFFRGRKLYVGFAYPSDNYKKITYDFQGNVKAEGNDLEYKSADDIKIKVEAISILENDNEKIKVELGDPEGAVRTMHFYNLNEGQLRRAAERNLERLKYSGFRGSFKAWGDPYPQHGDIANIKDDWYPEHVGGYFINRVVTKFGPGIGIDRSIHLGLRATGDEFQNAN